MNFNYLFNFKSYLYYFDKIPEENLIQNDNSEHEHASIPGSIRILPKLLH